MGELTKLKKALLFFVVLLVVSTIGYKLLLGVPLLSAIYMTVITISTVGYKEVAPMNDAALIFSILVIFLGIGVVGYALSQAAVVFIEGHLQRLWRGRVMEKKIKNLSDHYIICGHEEVAEQIARELQRSGKDFVLMDQDGNYIRRLDEHGHLTYRGSSLNEEDLENVAIANARGLVAVHPSDVDNIVTVLSARHLNEKMHIVALANEASSEIKLKRVGANAVLSSAQIGGKRLAALLIKPHVISFLDVFTKAGDLEVDLEQVILSKDSPLLGQTLAMARIPDKTGLIVLAIRRHDGEYVFNPSGDLCFELGDVLVTLGPEDRVNKLRELAKSE